MKGIADTGFVVAFANKNDIYHKWAIHLASTIESPLLTCEAVLAESAFHLQNISFVLSLLDSGLLELRFRAAEHMSELLLLARKFADQKPDFADICLIRMSELFPTLSVLTTDRKDFEIYRRNHREHIPILCPHGNSL
jgi:predicted nucleic acid-binding protein